MPQPVATEVMEEDVELPSADGTTLSARVYRPSGRDMLPTVLIFSPYWNGSQRGVYFKEQEDLGTREYADCLTPFLLRRGYAVVLADMRATRHSHGCFNYGGRRDQEDGHAVVEWIAAQPWSNGNVGMYGVSHPGYAAYATAVAAPPGLKAIIPIAPITSWYRSLYSGGARYRSTMIGYNGYMEAVSALPGTNVGSAGYAQNVLNAGCNSDSFARAQSLDGTMDEFWKERDVASHAADITAAVFHVHGTADENVKMDHFSAVWRAMATAGSTKKALLGPWGHGPPRVRNWELTALRWFEHWLRNNNTGMMDEPALTLIDQQGSERVTNHFNDGPNLVLEAGKGVLAIQAPEGTASYRTLPVPQELLASDVARPAALSYRTEPLAADLHISGSPRLILRAALDSHDGNFGVRLFAVNNDGAATYVTRGYADARHREGVQVPGADVVPGKMHRYEIELHAREYVIRAGDRLQLVVSGGMEIDLLSADNNGVMPDAAAPVVTIAEGDTKLLVPLAR